MTCDLGIRSLNREDTAQTAGSVADLAVGSLTKYYPFQLFSSSNYFDITGTLVRGSRLHYIALFLWFFCFFVLLSVVSTEFVSQKKCSWDTLLYPAYVMVIGWVADSAKPEGALWPGMRLSGDRPPFASIRLHSPPLPPRHASRPHPNDIF